MINGNINEFIDELEYQDHYVMYENEKYFFNGCQIRKNAEGKVVDVKLEICNISKGVTVFSVKTDSVRECIAMLIDAPVFNGKKIHDIEAEMEWIDG